MEDYYNPLTISQIANKTGQMMETGAVPSTGGMTKIYHGTPYLDEISKAGGFNSNTSYWSPDRGTALQYAKHNKFLRGTPWGKITGNVIEGSIPSAQAQALAKRGLTGTRELVLSGDEASNLYRSGIANVKGVPSWLRTFGRYIPKIMRGVGKLPLAGFASDALFGTTYTADTARDINNLLGVNTSPNVNRGGGNQSGGGGNQGGNQGGGGQAAGQRASAVSRPSGNAGYSNVRRYGRAQGGLASLWRYGRAQGGLASLWQR